MRAVTTNNKWVPRPYYSQYQAQADELNDITQRIRRLAKALRVVGVYDQSVPALQNLLNGTDNKMVAVDNWATMQEKGGIKGTVDFMPITDVATVLMQLYDARERVKAEIYEITGWSDIIRGVSKASETLGAQQLKADWAGARLKLLQKDVQRFVRDVFRLIGEIVAEHFGTEMLLLMAGVSPDMLQGEQGAQMLAAFKQMVAMMRDEKDRCALIDIESDSTLLPDEANDRKDRMDFVGAVGAFLQQAIPAAQQFPALGSVLGEILMFAVRSFRSARPLEQSFEQFKQTLASTPPQPPQGQGGDNGAAAAATANAKVQDTSVKQALGTQANQIKQTEVTGNLQLEQAKEANRHAEKVRELALREREVAVKEAELGIKATVAEHDQVNAEADRALEAVAQHVDRVDEHQARQEDRADASAERAAESHERAADRAAAAQKPGGAESA
jgi:hypothetical protein